MLLPFRCFSCLTLVEGQSPADFWGQLAVAAAKQLLTVDASIQDYRVAVGKQHKRGPGQCRSHPALLCSCL